ncbi:hypothetical protein JTE90_005302 [Oedothorax gibbosus]|uniref:Uncharacterized protein n=1 Tax=Oedothorax gibbosus TaxID=931172 RepID=A0AAV6UVX1_9ARAC|nr:hypothetical protein JTE90_005302 [Oedothorax gibbosus]
MGSMKGGEERLCHINLGGGEGHASISNKRGGILGTEDLTGSGRCSTANGTLNSRLHQSDKRFIGDWLRNYNWGNNEDDFVARQHGRACEVNPY